MPTRDGGLRDFRPFALPQSLNDSKGMDHDEARAEVLPRSECLALLGSVPVGRIVYTQAGLPAIQPVNFILHQGDIVVRTGEGTRLAKAAESAVVAFEVDEIDVEAERGWSVVVTGRSHGVWEPAELQALGRLPLRAWAPGRRDHFLRIRPEFVSGRRIRGHGPTPAPGARLESAER